MERNKANILIGNTENIIPVSRVLDYGMLFHDIGLNDGILTTWGYFYDINAKLRITNPD